MLPADDEGHDVSDAVRRIDVMYEQIAELTGVVRDLIKANDGKHVQTVIHKTSGMGAWGAAAVVACFATWIGVIVLALWESNLWAWKDIHDHRIGVLEAKVK